MSGPLSHLTVIELAGIGPGPFACMLLADMGARVLRIDRPPAPSRGGLDDLMRNDGVVDRGRLSLSLDMKDARAVEAPHTGQHTLELLAAAGYSPAEIDALVSAGVAFVGAADTGAAHAGAAHAGARA
ncbi:MAG: CoA transferase [Burkholderiales bacterium]|nr:CoA transferase [Burkholderiales bacterium]